LIHGYAHWETHHQRKYGERTYKRTYEASSQTNARQEHRERGEHKVVSRAPQYRRGAEKDEATREERYT
jgi:hypothetical protein